MQPHTGDLSGSVSKSTQIPQCLQMLEVEQNNKEPPASAQAGAHGHVS